MKSRKAFTLVELLVVLGIIAVLISILMPALSMARKQAATVKCANNMRQLMLAVTAYVSEHQGQLPYCNWMPSVNAVNPVMQYGEGWLFCMPSMRVGFGGDLDGTWSTTAPPLDGMKTGNLWPYLNNQEIYHCPDDDPAAWTGTHRLTSYLMNGAQAGYINALLLHRPGIKISQFGDNSHCVLLWEATSLTGDWNDGSSEPSQEVLADRHGNGANVAFLDGHVEWWAKGTYDYFAQLPAGTLPPKVAAGPNDLWCNPLDPKGGATY
jgi:prepilin-type processing-associated H-X9-DG protein/prepilin-type N-terminal cleavage/methylation domain-containing protein